MKSEKETKLSHHRRTPVSCPLPLLFITGAGSEGIPDSRTTGWSCLKLQWN